MFSTKKPQDLVLNLGGLPVLPDGPFSSPELDFTFGCK